MATKKKFLAWKLIKTIYFTSLLLWPTQELLSNPGQSHRSNSPVILSTGERVEVPVKGFSIIPPDGWEVYANLPGVTLLLEIPISKQAVLKHTKVYPRNILVLSFPNPVPIDSQTMKEFHKTLFKNFSNPARNLEKYNLYSSEIVKLKNGEPGILYYADFESQGQKMRQAHLVVSSEIGHFLISFTDIREHFENPQNIAIFQSAWNSLLSIELESSAPTRINWILLIFAGVAILILLWVGIAHLQRRKKFDESTLGPDKPNDEPTDSWNV